MTQLHLSIFTPDIQEDTQEDALNNDVEQDYYIEECRMFKVGKRAFKTRYGAIRHVAKMILLDKINQEVKKQIKGQIYSNQMIVELQKKIFQETYPNYAYADNGTSAFSQAVTKKARELMQKEKEQETARGKNEIPLA